MSEAIDPDAELLFAMQVTALGKDSTSRQTMRDILAAVRAHFVATIEAQKAEIAYLRSLREAQTDLTIKLAAALADIAERAEGCSPEAYCLGMVARKALGEELQ